MSLSSFVTHFLIYALPSIVVSYLTVRIKLEGESWGKRVTTVVSCAILLIFVSYFFQLLWGVFIPHDRIDPKYFSIPLFGGFFVGAVFPRLGSFLLGEVFSRKKKEESVRLRGKTVNFLTVIDREETVSPYRLEISKKERGALLELLKASLPEELRTLEFSTILRFFYKLESSAPASLEALPKSIRDRLLKLVSTSWWFQQEHAIEPLFSFLKTTDNLTSMTLSRALFIFHRLEVGTDFSVEEIPKESRAHLLKHFHNYFLSPFPRSQKEAMNIPCSQSWKCSEYLEKWGKESMNFMNEDTRVVFCKRAKEKGYTAVDSLYLQRGALTSFSCLEKIAPMKKEEVESLTEDNISTMEFSKILRVFYQLEDDPSALETLGKPIRDRIFKRVSASGIFQLEHAQEHATESLLSFLQTPDNLTSMTLSRALFIFHTSAVVKTRFCVEEIPEGSRAHLLKHFHTYFLSPLPRSKEEGMNIPCSQSRECSEYLEKWGEESMDFMNEDTRVAFCERAKEQGYTDFLQDQSPLKGGITT